MKFQDFCLVIQCLNFIAPIHKSRGWEIRKKYLEADIAAGRMPRGADASPSNPFGLGFTELAQGNCEAASFSKYLELGTWLRMAATNKFG